MAGPLRRVSQNYHWTLKRAHNDLHNSIAPDLKPAPASPRISTIVSPWDSARLQWKFKTECAELHEHLEQSFLILLGWWLTFKYLTNAAAEHFIAETDQAILELYKLTIRVTISITVWSLLTLVAPFRYAVPRLASFLTQPFLSLSANHLGANKREEIGTHPTLSPPPLPDEWPVQSSYVESNTYAHSGTEGGITAHLAVDASPIDSLKDGIENLQSTSAMRRPFHGSPSLDRDNRQETS